MSVCDDGPLVLCRSWIGGATEWLVTNDAGVRHGNRGGTLTRAYHGLLVAALDPPVAHRLVVASAQTDGARI